MNPSALLASTQETVKELVELSGFPVSFLEDSSINVLASIRIATPSSPIHVIRYRPGATSPDYQIAVEAGHAIRMFRHPSERRFRLSADPVCRAQVSEEVEKLHPDISQEQLMGLTDFLVDSIVLQLRSCPTGLLVEYGIYHAYPSLRPLQAQSLKEQLATNVKVLAPDQLGRFPKTIVSANRAMNSAFAICMSELLGEPHLAIPYRAFGLEQIGLDLLSDLPPLTSEEFDDRKLISAWAARLGLAFCLKWLPFN